MDYGDCSDVLSQGEEGCSKSNKSNHEEGFTGDVKLGHDDAEVPPLKRHYELFDIKPDHVENGVPVFKPSWDEFKDFYIFQKSINRYGMSSGIVKIIPPNEWFTHGGGPSHYSEDDIAKITFKSPITQEFTSQNDKAGCFSINNIEKKKSFNLLQWKKLSYQPNYLLPVPRGEKNPQYNKISKADQKKFNLIKGNSNHLPEDAVKGFNYNIDTSIYTDEKCDFLEKQYWKTISFSSPLYGADSLGSLFKDDHRVWNVAHLPNLLDWLPSKLPGVNDAYLYAGLWKATFSWHLEDQDLYSINYLHFGAPKQWYSIPQDQHLKFYKLMTEIFPDDYNNCSEFLRHKTFTASPQFLTKHGIQVNKIIHREREFIITYPYGYHSGFNYGYNLAESVNFALEEWLDIGAVSKKCECVDDSVSIDIRKFVKRLNGDLTESDSEIEPGSEPETANETGTGSKSQSPATSDTKKLSKSGHKASRKTIPKEEVQQCIFCPNKLSQAYLKLKKFELLDVVDCNHYNKGEKYGKYWKCHRICSEFIAELQIIKEKDWIRLKNDKEKSDTFNEQKQVEISNDLNNTEQGENGSNKLVEDDNEVNNNEVVIGYDLIPTARKNLKCSICTSVLTSLAQVQEQAALKFKGICFQCSYKKCTRAFHGTCSLLGGVLLTKDFGSLCRYHRPKNTSFDQDYSFNYLKDLAKGDFIQFKIDNDYYCAVTISNNCSESSVNLQIYPNSKNNDEVLEVSYENILIPAENYDKISCKDSSIAYAELEMKRLLKQEQKREERKRLKSEKMKKKEEEWQWKTPSDSSIFSIVSKKINEFELEKIFKNKENSTDYQKQTLTYDKIYANEKPVNFIEVVKPNFDYSDKIELAPGDERSKFWFYMYDASSDQVARFANNINATEPNDPMYQNFLLKKEVEKRREQKRIKKRMAVFGDNYTFESGTQQKPKRKNVKKTDTNDQNFIVNQNYNINSNTDNHNLPAQYGNHFPAFYKETIQNTRTFPQPYGSANSKKEFINYNYQLQQLQQQNHK